jgi:MauM/NapG family ferredoxin protein
MSEDSHLNRKGFFKEIFSFLGRGVSSKVESKLTRLLDAPLRPPGALEELEFLSACTRCAQCVPACPYSAIKRLPISAGVSANTPYIDPQVEACHLCEDFPCIAACDDGALLHTTPEQTRMGVAEINPEGCVSHAENQVCTLCYDVCPFPETAITMDQDFFPQLLEGCTGCGQCQKRCPTVPKGIHVISTVRYRVKQHEKDYYFGFIPTEKDD